MRTSLTRRMGISRGDDLLGGDVGETDNGLERT